MSNINTEHANFTFIAGSHPVSAIRLHAGEEMFGSLALCTSPVSRRPCEDTIHQEADLLKQASTSFCRVLIG